VTLKCHSPRVRRALLEDLRAVLHGGRRCVGVIEAGNSPPPAELDLAFHLQQPQLPWSDYRRGSGSHIGFIDHFNTQLVITLNYSAIADLHTLQITTAHAKSFLAGSVLSSSCLVTAPNNAYSSASGLKSSLNGGEFLLEIRI
jgi:hypothetical protein